MKQILKIFVIWGVILVYFGGGYTVAKYINSELSPGEYIILFGIIGAVIAIPYQVSYSPNPNKKSISLWLKICSVYLLPFLVGYLFNTLTQS